MRSRDLRRRGEPLQLEFTATAAGIPAAATATTSAATAAGPNYSEIQASVFTPNCAVGCHSGGAPSGGLNLEEANSYMELVGVASNQDANFDRVTPGDPDNSYLIQKLEGTASSGQQMPPGNPMAQADIDTIRQWITDGAIDDRAPASSPVKVTSLSPMPGASLSAGPAQILAGFDRPLDPSTVNATTYTLTGSGGDAIFGNGNDVLIAATSISVPQANPQSAVFDLTGVNLADDTYRVTIFGDGASVVMDLDANALDGEFFGNFPSGDDMAGGDFIAQFTVATPVTLGPTLDQIQAVIFTPTCASSNCHGSPTFAGGGLNLSDADASFASLVGVASTGNAAILRVAPNDPDGSYLIQKLEGNAGAQMPLGGQPLDPADIAEIRQWILDGALR